MKSLKLAKEELEKLISLCESVAKTGADPYSVDVKNMLMKLRSIVEKADNTELLVLDAETIYRIATVIALQHKWLKDRASSLLIDAQTIALKVLEADKKSLAHAFASSWRPIVSAEQLTLGMVVSGLEYFLSLPTRGPRPSMGDQAGLEGVSGDAAWNYSERGLIENDIKRLHGEMLDMRDEEGVVDYKTFVFKDGVEKVFERAYITAFILSEGLAEASKNPLTGQIKLRPFDTKVERRSVASLVVVMKRGAVLD
ncbi:MAG: hypothetical protein RMH74_00230 [Candidatus Caldarchaeum sp.]|nr:hypothetical protein [Candidatus Caldarchaeum sp.]